MNYSKNVYKAYLIVFFHNLIPAYVIERLFYEQRGITVMMVVLFEILYAAIIVVLEIPSGILADKSGRKGLLVISAALAALEFVILIYAHSFWVFASVCILAGVSRSFSSGAFNALLYDSMLEVKEQSHFQKVLGRINALDFTAALIAALSGSVLARFFDFELNYWLSAGSMLIAFGFTLSLKEPPIASDNENEEAHQLSFGEYFKGAIDFYKSNPRLAFMVLNAVTIGACINYLDEFWQLYLNDINFPILYFGVFSAATSLTRIPGNLVAGYLIKYFKEEAILFFVLAVTAIGFFITALLPGAIGIAAMVLLFLATGVVDPVVTGYLHHNASSRIRATVDSFQSLGERTIVFVVGLGFGYVASVNSVAIGFMFLGAVCLAFFVLIKIISKMK